MCRAEPSIWFCRCPRRNRVVAGLMVSWYDTQDLITNTRDKPSKILLDAVSLHFKARPESGELGLYLARTAHYLYQI